MGDEDLVVAVRLCDTVEEAEQPDPLCLRREDLATWRHFEVLLCGMYKYPPAAISVTYLDDESDWVQVGSDAELAEAVRIAKETGDILQLQVKRLDAEQLITFENTDSSSENTDSSSSNAAAITEAGQFVFYVPTTDPAGDVLQPLVYPHPPADMSSDVDGPAPATDKNDPKWLVYPHPTENKESLLTQEHENEHPWQQLSSFQFSGQPLAPKDLNALDTVSNHSSNCMWEEAANLSIEEKVRFMRSFMEANGRNINMQAECSKQKEDNGTEESLLNDVANEKTEVKVLPLCSERGSLGMNFIPNQDPFEINPDASPAYMEHVMISFNDDTSPTLAPKQAAASREEIYARYFRMPSVETDGAASVSFAENFQNKQLQGLLASTQPSQSCTQTRAIYTSTVPKCKVSKHIPVPMPRNLSIMEGAQSGANAVTIEIPSEASDFFPGSLVNKEEEIAASGGAATSASEETGEVMARGDSVAAAVSREVKVPSQADESYTANGDESQHKCDKKSKRSSSKTKHSSSKKDRSTEKKIEAGIGGAKPKVSDKPEKRSSEHRRKLEDSSAKESKKEEKKVKVTEDVESGEKVNVRREATALSRCDFAKYMKKTKKELHAAIVKDVTQVTEKYFNKVVEKTMLDPILSDTFGIRELAYHEGIYCDACNRGIIGIRYKCGNCFDFDLCSVCENKANFHDPSHVFLKLRNPARGAGICSGQRYCLLVENIYEAEKLKQMAPGLSESQCSDKQESHEQPQEGCESTEVPQSEQEGQAPDFETQQSSGLTVDALPSVDKVLDDDADFAEKQVEKHTGLATCDDLADQGLEEFSCLPAIMSMEKLLPATPVITNSEDAQCSQESPTPSDSSSSIVPVSPPLVLSPTAPSPGEVPQSTFWDHHSKAYFQNVALAASDGDDTDDLPELLSEITVRHSERFDEDEGDSSSFEDMASDTSDDFCVIEAPASHRDEYETIPGDVCEEEEDQSVTAEAYAVAEVVENTSESHEATEGAKHNNTSLNLLDEMPVGDVKLETDAEEKSIEEEERKEDDGRQEHEEKKQVEEEVRADTHSAEGGVTVDGLVHTMNEEERIRFAQLLKAEMDKEYEEELKRRAQELEKELRLQKEREFQIILEAKEKAAAFENEKLEWVTQKKEEEERLSSISRQTSTGSIRSLGRSISDDGASGIKKDADCQTVPEPLSPASHIIQNVASGVSKAAVSAFYTAKDVFYSLQAKQTEWKSSSSTCRPPLLDPKFVKNHSQQNTEQADGTRQIKSPQLPPTPEGDLNPTQSSAQCKDTTEDVQSPTNSVESCESENSMQNRDFQQSLESAAVPKPTKAPHPAGCWAPQMGSFKLPTSDWTPPKDEYVPPTSTWTPPKREFIPPNIEWITTGRGGRAHGLSADAEKKRENKESDGAVSAPEPQESSRRPSLMTSQKAPSLATLEIADTALRRELQGMQRLIEMGFANREKNRQLLNKFDNDLEKVVQCLLQEEGEGEDSHWSFRRH